jgi:RNA polymerase sigma-70 factor (ECF subfamily)
MSSLPSQWDEQAVVERAKRDPAAFGELYDRYFLQIYRFVYSKMRDQTAAEDVTSEVFMKALKNIGRYQDTGKPFSAWLYQIAMNAVFDRYRSARPVEDIDDRRDLAVDGPGLEEMAARRDELRRIWAVVETLPKPQQVAMVLKFQEDMKIDDIAAVMGKSAGAVKLLIHRGVTRVRQTVGSTV